MSVHQLHPTQEPLTWGLRLKGATTEGEVVSIARDFLATMTPGEWSRFPTALRPKCPVDAADITGYAFDLFREDFREAEPSHPIHRLSRFFADASVRLSEILAVATQESDALDEQRSA